MYMTLGVNGCYWDHTLDKYEIFVTNLTKNNNNKILVNCLTNV